MRLFKRPISLPRKFVAAKLFSRPTIAANKIRGVFTRRPNGFLGPAATPTARSHRGELDFHVSGPFNSPKTDLAERLVKGAAEQFLEKEFQKGFEKILK